MQIRKPTEVSRTDKLRQRLLKFLTRHSCIGEAVNDGKEMLLTRRDGQTLRVPKQSLRDVLSSGLVKEHRRCGDAHALTLGLSEEGRKRLADRNSGPTVKNQSEDRERLVRNDGSPLARLFFAKSKVGYWINKEEYHAGERLRIDFEKSQVSKSLGVNWDAIGMPRQPSGHNNTEDGDFADAARMRVARALNAVGPELSGLLLDVCCFLKGLEQVEAERQWPRRSAKLLLKVALATLDRHYNPPPMQRASGQQVWQSTQ